MATRRAGFGSRASTPLSVEHVPTSIGLSRNGVGLIGLT
jgi:hypothetical protein